MLASIKIWAWGSHDNMYITHKEWYIHCIYISDSVQSLYVVTVDQKFKTLYSTGHAAVSFIFIDINFRG